MEVNISRTAAEAEASSRAPAGAAPTMRSAVFCALDSVATLCFRHLDDLFHGCYHGLRRHIVGDLYLSDCRRQDKMRQAAERLFVRQKPLHNALPINCHLRQRT